MSRRSPYAKKWAIVTAASTAAVHVFAHAASLTYVGPNNGSFLTSPSPWSTGGYPNSGDDVYVGAAEPAGDFMTVNLNYGYGNYSSGGFNSLRIDAPSTSTMQIDEEPASASTAVLNATELLVADNGLGSATLVQGGAGTCNNTITTCNVDAGGEYDITSATSMLTVSSQLDIASSATMRQNAGLVTANGNGLTVGGSYFLSGGTLNAGAFDLNGSVTQTGGTLSVTSGDATLAGTYTLSNSSGPSVLSSSGGFIVSGGTLDASAGTVTTNGTGDFIDTGNVQINGTATLSVNEFEEVTYLYEPTMTQAGGVVNASTLVVANESGTGTAAVYALNQGSLSISGQESIGKIFFEGYGGQGNITQSGGTNTTASLQIGDTAPGEYDLSGTGTVSAGNAVVGSGTTIPGTLKILGGSFDVTGTLTLTNSAGTSATLSAGTLQVGSLLTNGNPSLFNWTGGTLYLTDQVLDFTSTSDSDAPLGKTLTIGSGQALITGIESLLDSGVGITQNGGTNSTTSLGVANRTSTTGNAEYDLYAGTLTAVYEAIGIPSAYGNSNGGGGYFAQYGGNNNPQNLTISYIGTGTYYLSAGALDVGSTLTINSAGTMYVEGGMYGTAAATASAPSTENNGDFYQQSIGTVSLGALTGTGYLSIGNPFGGTCPLNVASISQQTVIISNTGKLTINSNSVAVSNVIESLAISGNGVLDLTNNKLIINYGSGADPMSSIAAWIASGYDHGTWTGPGIDSISAAGNSASYGIGYADYADPGNPAGLSSGQIEIMYTLLGDANLDGKVNGTDFELMATNFNQAVTNGWDEGDFNDDGKVNGSDFVLLADNFNQFASQSAVSAADLAALDNFAAANGISLTNVPEPASAGMLIVAGLGILRRRRPLPRD